MKILKPLTDRQRQILRFIAGRLMDDSPPTVREIAAQFDIRSTNGVNDHLLVLQRKGVLVFPAAKSRAMRLTDAGWTALGYGSCPTCGARQRPGKVAA